MEVKNWSAALVSFGCVIAGGCGGTGTVSGAEGRELTYGDVYTRSVGGAKEPVFSHGSETTVTGVFGANFTNITLNLPPVTADNVIQARQTTNIAVMKDLNPLIIPMDPESVPFSVGPPQVARTASLDAPAISPLGDQIAWSEFDAQTELVNVVVANLDGSGRTVVATNASAPAWSPTNPARLAFVQDGDIFAINRDGTGLQRLTEDALPDSLPAFSPDGTKVGFIRNTTGVRSWCEVNATGGGFSQVKVINEIPPGLRIHSVAYLGNSRTLLLGVNLSSLTFCGVITINLDTPGSKFWIETDSPAHPSPSPDGQAFVYRAQDGQSLMTYDMNTGITSSLREFGPNNQVGPPRWGPALRRRAFIAPTGAAHHTNAAGFLHSTGENGFRALVTFDASNRNTVEVAMQTSGGSSPSAMAVITAGNALTMLRYSNGISARPVTVIDHAVPQAAVQGAVVTFGGSSGRVTSVLAFSRSRSGQKPVSSSEGNRTVWRGDFVGVWDEKGQRTESAQEVTIAADGTIESIR